MLVLLQLVQHALHLGLGGLEGAQAFGQGGEDLLVHEAAAGADGLPDDDAEGERADGEHRVFRRHAGGEDGAEHADEHGREEDGADGVERHRHVEVEAGQARLDLGREQHEGLLDQAAALVGGEKGGRGAHLFFQLQPFLEVGGEIRVGLGGQLSQRQQALGEAGVDGRVGLDGGVAFLAGALMAHQVAVAAGDVVDVAGQADALYFELPRRAADRAEMPDVTQPAIHQLLSPDNEHAAPRRFLIVALCCWRAWFHEGERGGGGGGQADRTPLDEICNKAWRFATG